MHSSARKHPLASYQLLEVSSYVCAEVDDLLTSSACIWIWLDARCKSLAMTTSAILSPWSTSSDLARDLLRVASDEKNESYLRISK